MEKQNLRIDGKVSADIEEFSFHYSGICDEMQIWLGKHMQTERKHRFMTQNQLADRLFVSPSTISKLESGRVFNHMELFFKLCDQFSFFAGQMLLTAHQECLSRRYPQLFRFRKKEDNIACSPKRDIL